MRRVKMKVLFYDLETSAMVGLAFKRYDTNLIKVKKDWELLSFAYKWQGNSKVTVKSRRTFKNEKSLVKELHKVLSQADVVVTHNGISFDNKKSNAKFAQYRFKPVKPQAQRDTCSLAKRTFGFTSNSLNELCTRLDIGEKIKFTSGPDLWDSAAEGNKKALKEMETYNKHDVVLLETLHDRLIPFTKLLPKREDKKCPSCYSDKAAPQGTRGRQQRLVCRSCGHWFQVPIKRG
jgi:uncharacterized protein YprB with RNaseH-like and TPR domain